MITDLELAVATLLVKEPIYTRYFRYYEGDHPLVYSRDRLHEIFSDLNARFSQNWCAVVVDAVLERIQLQRIMIADNEAMTDRLDDIIKSSALTLESDDAHLAALVTGESFIIVWPDDETGDPSGYYNDPRNVHVFYEANRPRVKRFAAKWWIGDDDHRYLTLYYPDHLEYYRSIKAVLIRGNGVASTNEVQNAKSFEPFTSSEVNPYGIVPVFHFRRDRRKISSELQNIIEPQDAVNKLLADMMIAAEFGAFRQRWIISEGAPGKFKNAPSTVWDVPAQPGDGQATSIGEFEITPLANYLEGIDKWTSSIAIISRTPKHYFMGQSGDPSGEALIAMESPLNHKAQKYIDRFTATWSELAQFLLLLDGAGEVDDNSIIPIFDKPETVQPYTQALIRKESVAAGIPLMWQMQQEGFTEEELAELEGARTEQADQDMERMAQVMEQRQSNFAQNGNGARSNGQPPRQRANAR